MGKVHMNTPSRRQARLADQIRAAMAEMIGAELKDPRIGFVTVTRVELTADLHQARVWVSVLGGANKAQPTLEGLTSATGYLRRELSHRLRLRRAPEIFFRLDRGPEESDRLEHLLQELHRREGDS